MICRAGRGSLLPVEMHCPNEATKPALRTPGGPPRWCAEHEAALRRVAVACSFLPPDLDDVIARLVEAGSEPLTKAQLAIRADVKPTRNVFADALAAALSTGALVTTRDGNATKYARPEVAPVPPAPTAPARRPRSEQAAELSRLVIDNGGTLSRDAAVAALGIAPTSLGHLVRVAFGHGWLEGHGQRRKDGLLRAGPTAPPVAVAA